MVLLRNWGAGREDRVGRLRKGRTHLCQPQKVSGSQSDQLQELPGSWGSWELVRAACGLPLCTSLCRWEFPSPSPSKILG